MPTSAESDAPARAGATLFWAMSPAPTSNHFTVVTGSVARSSSDIGQCLLDGPGHVLKLLAGGAREHRHGEHLVADPGGDGAALVAVAQFLERLPGPHCRVVPGRAHLVALLQVCDELRRRAAHSFTVQPDDMQVAAVPGAVAAGQDDFVDARQEFVQA